MRFFNSATSHNSTQPTTYHQYHVALTGNETTVSSQLTVAATSGLNGSEIGCVTYFSSTSLPTSATNIPTYRHTWTSPTLDVRCKLF